MGGGPFYNHNTINNMNHYIPLTEQSQYQRPQQADDEDEQRRQQYHNRVSMCLPKLHIKTNIL